MYAAESMDSAAEMTTMVNKWISQASSECLINTSLASYNEREKTFTLFFLAQAQERFRYADDDPRKIQKEVGFRH